MPFFQTSEKLKLIKKHLLALFYFPANPQKVLEEVQGFKTI
jgi:hypothetical protein